MKNGEVRRTRLTKPPAGKANRFDNGRFTEARKHAPIADNLRTHMCTLSRSQLRELARRRGVPGVHRLKKQQLLDLLFGVNRLALPDDGSRKSHAAQTVRPGPYPAAIRPGNVDHRGNLTSAGKCSDLGSVPSKEIGTEDDATLLACAPCWLQVRWRIHERSMERVRRSQEGNWDSAVVSIRLIDCSRNESLFEKNRTVYETDVEPGVSCWFIEVPSHVRRYRAEVGYRTSRGHFHVIAHSNEAASLRADSHCENKFRGLEPAHRRCNGRLQERRIGNATRVSADRNSACNGKRIHPSMMPHSVAIQGESCMGGWRIDLKAEMIVYGQVSPGTILEVEDVPIQMSRDGCFRLRCNIDEGRNIIPATVRTSDGCDERLIVLGIERNTRFLDPNPGNTDE